MIRLADQRKDGMRANVTPTTVGSAGQKWHPHGSLSQSAWRSSESLRVPTGRRPNNGASQPLPFLGAFAALRYPIRWQVQIPRANRHWHRSFS
ncbi:MAG: hypothetical protein ABIP20_20345 [Chthoniobacteraceae bacterium]